MDIRPGELIFNKDECSSLATIFSHYLRCPGAELSDDFEDLRRIWAKVSDMSILPLISSSQELLAEIIPHRSPAVTPEEIASGKIAVPRSRAFVEVINWAARELVVGSPTHTGMVGQTLDSEELDLPWPLAISNESFAQRRAASLLAAGQLAAVWAAQLDV